MRWEDETYVRLYVRDTTTWKLFPWQAKALLPLLLRKLDWAGIADVGEDALRGIAALTDMPLEVVAAGLPELLASQTFELHGTRLLMPKYQEAQTAAKSDRLRKRESRGRARAEVTKPDGTGTKRDKRSRSVTPSHGASQTVTDGHSGAGAGAGAGAQSALQTSSPVVEPSATLPGKPAEALAVLAASSGGRFAAVEPRDIGRAHAIALVAAIKRYPLRAEWVRLGAWLAAGGLAWKGTLGIGWAASAGLNEAMALARAWDGVGPVAARAGPAGVPQRGRIVAVRAVDVAARGDGDVDLFGREESA